jgi:hypothetical protein
MEVFGWLAALILFAHAIFFSIAWTPSYDYVPMQMTTSQ